MSNQPELVSRDEQAYVAIPIQVPLRAWGRANKLIGDVRDWLDDRGVQPVGAPFIRYLVVGDRDGDYTLEVGWLVDDPVTGAEPVQRGAIPAGRFGTLVHHGHPDRLDGAHRRLQEWLATAGLAPETSTVDGVETWAARYEFFLTEPTRQPDPDQWDTRILYLLRDTPAR